MPRLLKVSFAPSPRPRMSTSEYPARYLDGILDLSVLDGFEPQLGAIPAFTLLQLACLGVLWFVKSSGVGILFPVFIAMLVPIRLLAARFFTTEHLAALDAEEEPEEEETHWAV